MTQHTSIRIARSASLLSIPALALLISVSTADAREGGYYGHAQGRGHGYGHSQGQPQGHGNRHGHGHEYGSVHVRYPAPGYVVRPRYSPYPAYPQYVGYPRYSGCSPYPVHAPIVRPYPLPAVPYVGVNGYIGIGGPNFSLSIGF
jgi:hypothetical protein